jgi:predicted nicotinamide N-methyase
MPPRFHRTPPEIVADRVRETVPLDGHTFILDCPADPDAILKHPAVDEMYAADEYRPYWVRLWPAARMLAAAVLREPWAAAGEPLDVLEIGCGLGLAGIAALARGLRVTFSDVDETALTFATANARFNGFTDFRTLPLDLRSPPAGLKFPVVLGSDLIYQDRLVTPLVGLLRAVLAPGGVCLVTDPDRPDRRRFEWKLTEAGYAVTTDPGSITVPGGDAGRGTLYRIRERAA